MHKETLEKWKTYQYYIIIGILSIIALFFLPMIGSEAGLVLNLPTTAIGWIVYVITKLLVAVLNILIFHCFVKQGKVNILGHPDFIEANTILAETQNVQEFVPRSPKQWNLATYGKKGLTIFVTTLISVIGLTQAVLTFDWVSKLTSLFTVIMGIIFGILQMNETERYWTEEYLQYAKKVQTDAARLKEKEEEIRKKEAALKEKEKNTVAETEEKSDNTSSACSSNTENVIENATENVQNGDENDNNK